MLKKFLKKYNIDKHYCIVLLIVFGVGFLLGGIMALIKILIQKSC